MSGDSEVILFAEELRDFRKSACETYYTKIKENLKSQMTDNPFASYYPILVHKKGAHFIGQRLVKDGFHVIQCALTKDQLTGEASIDTIKLKVSIPDTI